MECKKCKDIGIYKSYKEYGNNITTFKSNNEIYNHKSKENRILVIEKLCKCKNHIKGSEFHCILFLIIILCYFVAGIMVYLFN